MDDESQQQREPPMSDTHDTVSSTATNHDEDEDTDTKEDLCRYCFGPFDEDDDDPKVQFYPYKTHTAAFLSFHEILILLSTTVESLPDQSNKR